MTVQELINKLSKIENKNKEILYTDYNFWWDIEVEEEDINVYILRS